MDSKNGNGEVIVSSQDDDSLISRNSTSNDRKPVLVLINPCSGRGKSMEIYRKFVVPMFQEHQLSHEVFVTKSDLRVPEYLRSLKKSTLMDYEPIVVISGDGLLHETINALMTHPDRPKLKQIPLGIVPAGSGNGLAYTLIRQTFPSVKTKNEAIKTCCEQIIKNNRCSTDLVEITFTSKQRPTIWSFLSIGWGLMANIDIDSEWLRFIGEFRFSIYGVVKSITNLSHKGRLSYRVDPEYLKLNPSIADRLKNELNSSSQMYNEDSKVVDREFEDPRTVHIEDTFSCLYATNQRYISRDTQLAPKSTLTDKVIYLTYVRGKMSFCKSVQFLFALEDGSHDQLPFVTVVPVKSFKFQPLEPSRIVIDGELIDWTVEQGPMKAKVLPKAMTLAWTSEDKGTDAK